MADTTKDQERRDLIIQYRELLADMRSFHEIIWTPTSVLIGATILLLNFAYTSYATQWMRPLILSLAILSMFVATLNAYKGRILQDMKSWRADEIEQTLGLRHHPSSTRDAIELHLIRGRRLGFFSRQSAHKFLMVFLICIMVFTAGLLAFELFRIWVN